MKTWNVSYSGTGGRGRRKIMCEVRWSGRADDAVTPAFVRTLVETLGIWSVRWRGH